MAQPEAEEDLWAENQRLKEELQIVLQENEALKMLIVEINTRDAEAYER